MTTETLVPTATDNPTPITEEVIDSNLKTPEPVVKEEPKPEEDPKFAARFAALSRKERDLINREKAAKQAQQEHVAFQEQLAVAKKDPIAYLQAAGFTLEQAVQQILAQGEEPTAEQKVAADVEKINAKIKAYEEAQQAAQQRANEVRKEQEESQILTGIKSFVEANEEKYSTIIAYDAISDVWEVIKKTYLETQGKVHLTEEQAAQAVEDHLLEEAKQEAARLKKVKKLQLLTESKQVSNPIEVRTVSPTLTNQSATSPVSTPQKLNREQSLAAAAKLLKWKE
jgi:hypothetical protein